MAETSFKTSNETLDALPEGERFLLPSQRAMSAACCPGSPQACSETAACPAVLPAQGAERTAILVLRFIAGARDNGDACCWDAALDQAEAAFGEHRGPLVVARAGALVRRLARACADIVFLPPPCRRLSSGETLLLGALRGWTPGHPRLDAGPFAEDVAALARSIAPADSPQPRQAA